MGEIHRSRWSYDIPKESFPDYVFKSVSGPLSDEPLFVDVESPTNSFITLWSFRSWSKRLAFGLQKAGLESGDRCLFISSNTVLFPIVFMGVVMAGGVFTGANPAYTARELAYQIEDSEPKIVVTADILLGTVLQAAKEARIQPRHIFTLGSADAILNAGSKKHQGPARQISPLSDAFASIEEGDSFSWKTVLTSDPDDQSIALNYSSGTTGLPKGVQITHRNYIANTSALVFISQLDPQEALAATVPRLLFYLPFYHAMAQTMCFVAIMRKSVGYVMSKFDLKKVLENVQKFKITELSMAPPIVVAMVKDPRVKEFDLSSVRRVLSGAAPLSGATCKQFESLWPPGHVKIQQGWGMTEATSLITSWDPTEYADPSSVGELGPNLEAKMNVLEEFSKQYNRPVGEFLVRGPNVMKGYWKNKAATEDTISSDGWLKTGDVGYFENGRVFIVDRLKELIKVKGFQVAPAELEGLLLDHPDVSDAAVVGVKVDGQEVPRAYIVPGPSPKASASEIRAFIDRNVAHYKHLVGGVFFVKAIPKNPSGKILRSVVRSWVPDADATAQKPKANL